MTKHLLTVMAGLTLVGAVYAQTPPKGNQSTFIENKGQWDGQAQYLSQTDGLNLWLTPEGAVYDVYRVDAGTKKGHVLRMSFANGNPTQIDAVQQVPGRLNYFVGPRSHWARGVRQFGEVRAAQIYRGVAARYYFDHGAPRYDLMVAPNADPSQIAMRFEGQNSLRVLANGNLQIGTSLGAIEERGLHAYQSGKTGKVGITCSMTTDGQTVKFLVGNYDRTKPLVIDPLIFSTYVGPQAGVARHGVALDAHANVVLAGTTSSLSFPITTGAYHSSAGTIFISKLSADGTQLLWSSVFGSGTSDQVDAIALDHAGNVFALGGTTSPSFPITTGAFQSAIDTNGSGFICKLSADGSQLLASTAIGSAGIYPRGLAVDSTGRPVGLFDTTSSTFPTTVGAYRPNYLYEATVYGPAPYFGDNALIKLNSNLTSEVWGTYIGPVRNYFSDNVMLDGSDNVFVAGNTNGNLYPTTPGTFMTTFDDSAYVVGYVTKMRQDASGLVYSTYIGETGSTTVSASTLDPFGHVELVEAASNVPVTVPSSGDHIVIRMTTDGNLLASVELYNNAGSLACSQDGDLYFNAANSLLHFAPNLSSYTDILDLPNSTSEAIAVNPGGNPVVAGVVNNNGFATTPGAYQTVGDAGYAFALKTTGPFYLSLAASSVAGGQTVAGSVNVSVQQDTVVPLSSDSQAAQVPPNVTVKAGQSSAQFTVTTSAVSSDTVATISATLGAVTSSQQLLIYAPRVPAISVSPSAVYGGYPSTGTITLSHPATPGGATVTLFSSDNVAGQVPPSVSFAAGQTVATFPIKTAGVDFTTYVTIHASNGGTTTSASLTVNKAPLTKLGASATTIVGGHSFVATIGLLGFAGPSGATVSLALNTAATSGPSSVKIVAQTSAKNVLVNTFVVSVNTPVTLTATYDGTTKTCNVTVTPPNLATLGVPSSPVVGGDVITVSVTLDGGAPSGGATITLFSTDQSVPLPASVTIPAGNTTKSFTVTTKSVKSDTRVTVAATYLNVTISRGFTVTAH